jgi:Fic family protein
MSTEPETAKLQIDPRKADAAYNPFPTFEDWLLCDIETTRWERYTASLEGKNELSPDLLRRAQQVVAKAAAVDTGAIEGLYETDRGFTFTVATEAALWQAVIQDKKGSKVLSLIESQLHGYEHVLDFATKQVPIAEAWIRTLHEEICHAQDTYTAYTEIGIQELPLPKGEYKNLPNHVITRDGSIHSYAPVDLTPVEMHRLCEQLNTSSFLAAHPILQSSYAHYALVAIHPFADGNGRVARALASVFTYRSNSIPLLILAENRDEYLSTLRSADKGNRQPFVDFTRERALDAIRLFDDSLRTATTIPAADALRAIKALYVTKGGYTHKQVDEAGFKLMDLIMEEFVKYREKIAIEGMVGFNARNESSGFSIPNNAYRHPLSAPRTAWIHMSTNAPANASVARSMGLEVPKDCGKDDDLIVRENKGPVQFEARITELMPFPQASLQMRISMFVERIINEMATDLNRKAEQAYRSTLPA